MTTPTKAQIIEALNIGKAACLVACALEPIRANWKKWENAADIIERQAAALTAAAEVGEQPHLVSEIHRQHREIERLKVQIIERDSAIAGWIKRTAAAEAGDDPYKDVPQHLWDMLANNKNATIERCAQYHDNAARECDLIAAANMDNDLGRDCITRAQDHREDAAAIRALKERS